MADIYTTFYNYVRDNEIIRENDQIIIGLSGGADSMCLLVLLDRLSSEMHLNLTAVHVNHQLRGKEADEDEKYVKEFCEKKNIMCIGVHANVRQYAIENGLSLEEAGRVARYQTFYQVARKLAKNDIIPDNIKAAVAHHRDDNAETILMNLIRGTGLKGLRGMQPVARRFDMTVIRPMLCLGRSEIEEFLKSENIKYCTDSTNLKDEYARNKVRLNIIPLLNTINKQAAAHINEAARDIVQAQEYIEDEARRHGSLVIDRRDDSIYVDLSRFGTLNKAVKSQIVRNIIEEMAGRLKDVSRVHIDSVLALEEKQTGRKVELPYGIMVVRSYSNLIFKMATDEDRHAHDMTRYARSRHGLQATEDVSDETENCLEDVQQPEELVIDPTVLTTDPVRYQLWNGLEIELNLVHVNPVTRQYLIAKNDYTKAFDCAKIKGNLVFRKPESQDVIHFFGGSKSVKKFFVDEKIPQEERQNALVMTDKDQVMWILGYRMSENFKLSEMTNMALQVTICMEN